MKLQIWLAVDQVAVDVDHQEVVKKVNQDVKEVSQDVKEGNQDVKEVNNKANLDQMAREGDHKGDPDQDLNLAGNSQERMQILIW